MSTSASDHDPDKDVWERLAEHREALEMAIEEDTAFKPQAKRLLKKLEEEGY